MGHVCEIGKITERYLNVFQVQKFNDIKQKYNNFNYPTTVIVSIPLLPIC